MHRRDSQGTDTVRVLTQLEADDCCAASEREESGQSSPAFVLTSAVLGSGTVLPVTVPALVLTDGWRPAAPIPIAPVPRHILLSVFLL
jgi:hypothetical protein